MTCDVSSARARSCNISRLLSGHHALSTVLSRRWLVAGKPCDRRRSSCLGVSAITRKTHEQNADHVFMTNSRIAKKQFIHLWGG